MNRVGDWDMAWDMYQKLTNMSAIWLKYDFYFIIGLSNPLMIVDGIVTHFICAEIRIKPARKMGEQLSSELAVGMAVILVLIDCHSSQPKSCSRHVRTN